MAQRTREGKVQAGTVNLDQAQLLGRHQSLRAWPGNSRSG
jgi:undecaprenyl pyrophosphate phosphatase UppP